MFDRSFDEASFDVHEGPMRCCLTVPQSSDCQTVPDTTVADTASGGKLLAVWSTQSACSCSGIARVWTKTQLHCHARVWTKTQGRGRKLVAIQTVAFARVSNELMQSAVRAVLLQCSRCSRPSQNASTQRGCLPQRPDPCRHSLPLRSRPGQHHQSC